GAGGVGGGGEGGGGGGGGPGGGGGGVVGRGVAGFGELRRGGETLGDRARRKTADEVDRGSAQHGAAAAEEGRVVIVLAALDDAEEQRLLGPDRFPFVRAPVLVGIQVVEILRRLHERDGRIVEIAEGLGEKALRRRVVGVEHGKALGGREEERVVEVARLCAGVVPSRDVATPELGRELAQLRPVAVVEQPGLVRIVHVPGREQRAADHLAGLVVRRDEYVHGE